MPAPNGTSKRRPLAALELAGTALLAVAGLSAGLVMLGTHRGGNSAAELRQAVAKIAEVRQTRVTMTRALEEARARARVVEREAETAVSRAEAARARARVVGVDDVQVSAVPNAEPAVVCVPPPVVERMQLDSTAVAALRVLLQWKDTVIVRQDERITADSLELLARANAFTALQRVKAPRCGRRCGIILGVGGMLAAAVAVEQVRRTFR
jgi:hypothetical protein